VEGLESRRLLTTITEFKAAVTGDTAVPSEIAVGPNGTLWFISGENELWSLSTNNPNPQPYPTKLGSGTSALGITMGPDNNSIWFTEYAPDNRVGMLNFSDQTHTLHFYDTTDGMTANSGPVGITSDGTFLWFTQNLTHQIGRLDPSTGHITEYPAPTAITNLNSRLVLGPDGNLWFTELGAIGVFDRNSGTVIKNVPIPPPPSSPPGSVREPLGIAVGPDGNIWYTDQVLDSNLSPLNSYGVGTVNTNTQQLISEIPVASSSNPYGIAPGADGNVWFSVTSPGTAGGTIDAISPSTRTVVATLTIPTNVVSMPDPQGVTRAPDGNIWFADGGGAIGVVNDLQLVATAQPPPDVSVNSPFGVVVQVEYSSLAVDTAYSGNVTLALGNNPGGASTVLSGTLTVPVVAGVANFSGLKINNAAGGYTLNATSSATVPPTALTTSAFNIVNGPATHLVVTTEPPASVPAGAQFAVTVTDEFVSGPVDTSFQNTLTIALGANPGGASTVLGGNVSIAATNGVATFSGLTLNNLAQGYTLIVSGSGIASATTTAFAVTVATPPTITGEQVVTIQKRNKKGKLVGKSKLSGYTIDYSASMNQGSIGTPGNYEVDLFVPKKQRRKKVLVPRPIGFAITSVTSNTVTLTLAGNQKFPKGGRLLVRAAGIEDTSGVFLAADGVFTISPGGRAIH
jgi:virginiamycin B lyase